MLAGFNSERKCREFISWALSNTPPSFSNFSSHPSTGPRSSFQSDRFSVSAGHPNGAHPQSLEEPRRPNKPRLESGEVLMSSILDWSMISSISKKCQRNYINSSSKNTCSPAKSLFIRDIAYYANVYTEVQRGVVCHQQHYCHRSHGLKCRRIVIPFGEIPCRAS